MRGFLRGLLTWLDRRFPERVVITQAEFLSIKARIDELEKQKVTEARIQKIEGEINKFNVSMGFGGTMPKAAMPWQR